MPQETHLKNLKQLTNGGENAEAYFSFDGQRLSFQSTRGSHGCDQIYTMKIDGADLHLISGDKGRTTCSFYYPDGKHLLYASTHLGGDAVSAAAEQAQGYVWAMYDAYDIFRTDPDGTNPVRLTSTPGYDAEATIAKDGRVVFTSVRDGDMEIYSMNGDGTRRAPAHESARPGRRRVFLARRIADRLSRLSSARRRGARRFQQAAQARAVAADVARDLRDEPRRQQSPAGHAFRQGELGAILDARRQEASSSRRT